MTVPEQKSGGALVLFSGGQDSTVCLAWALERFERVETVGFDYGQRHAVELTVRATVRDKLAALKPAYAARLGEDHPVKVDALAAISETALTRDTAIEMADNGLPTTFVPGRNLLFLVLAGAIAYRRNLSHLVGGMCETDYSGYPDCDAVGAHPRPRPAADRRHAADGHRQGRNLRAGGGDRRRGAAAADHRGNTQLLPRRP